MLFLNAKTKNIFVRFQNWDVIFVSVQAEEVFAEPMFESTLYTLAVIVACIKDKDLFCSNQEETKKKEGMVLV